MKWIIIGVVVLLFMIDTWILSLMMKKPKALDPRTFEIYDETDYKKWLHYQKAKVRLSFVSKITGFVFILLMLALNGHFKFFDYTRSLNIGVIYQNLVFLLIINVIMLPITIGISFYSTFKIEEKYGFNNQTVGLFIKDTVTETLLMFVIEFGVIIGLNQLFISTGIWFLLYGILAVNVFVFLTIFLMPLFTRLFNKFSPLEAGRLKDEIDQLLKDANSDVSNILIMNASKRTKKMNAYFSGFGKKRRIVLYDTIIDGMAEDEVVAVLAHELGHAKHKDMLKMLPLSMASLSLLILLSYILATSNALSEAFGFSSANFIFSLLILFEVMDIFMKLIKIPQNKFIRSMEYKADNYAATMESKEAMVGALKKLTKVNFADLNPHPYVVALLYDHPTIFQRIDAIEKGLPNK